VLWHRAENASLLPLRMGAGRQGLDRSEPACPAEDAVIRCPLYRPCVRGSAGGNNNHLGHRPQATAAFEQGYGQGGFAPAQAYLAQKRQRTPRSRPTPRHAGKAARRTEHHGQDTRVKKRNRCIHRAALSPGIVPAGSKPGIPCLTRCDQTVGLAMSSTRRIQRPPSVSSGARPRC